MLIGKRILTPDTAGPGLLFGVSPGGGAGATGLRDGPQRGGQDHAAQHRDGRAARHRRIGHLRGHDVTRLPPHERVRLGMATSPRGTRASPAHRARQPPGDPGGRRRAARRRWKRHWRPFPGRNRCSNGAPASCPAGSSSSSPSPAPWSPGRCSAGRAHRGHPAVDHHRDRGGDRAAARLGPVAPAGRAVPGSGAAAGRPLPHPRRRARRPLGGGRGAARGGDPPSPRRLNRVPTPGRPYSISSW